LTSLLSKSGELSPSKVDGSVASLRGNGAHFVPAEIGALAALAYADLFDYPLTSNQVVRYQVGTHYSREQIDAAIATLVRDGGAVVAQDQLYAFRGRGSTFLIRKHREKLSASVWRRARLWGRFVARTPFVRAVAITGALSMNNISGKPDIDMLVVAQPGRVWICRRLLILQVRLGRLFGDDLCPNYILSARNLHLDQCDFFTAHELAQMVPLYGEGVLAAMLSENSWASEYLPSAFRSPYKTGATNTSRIRRSVERALGNRIFDRWEAWELRRLRAKLAPLIGRAAEVVCSPEQCKGHTGLHRTSVLKRYRARLQSVGIYDSLAFLLDADVEDEDAQPMKATANSAVEMSSQRGERGRRE